MSGNFTTYDLSKLSYEGRVQFVKALVESGTVDLSLAHKRRLETLAFHRAMERCRYMIVADSQLYAGQQIVFTSVVPGVTTPKKKTGKAGRSGSVSPVPQVIDAMEAAIKMEAVFLS